MTDNNEYQNLVDKLINTTGKEAASHMIEKFDVAADFIVATASLSDAQKIQVEAALINATIHYLSVQFGRNVKEFLVGDELDEAVKYVLAHVEEGLRAKPCGCPECVAEREAKEG